MYSKLAQVTAADDCCGTKVDTIMSVYITATQHNGGEGLSAVFVDGRLN